ncbi:MAG: NAD(P)/FAD-dependent oxidoreductase [Candidatus Korarchaeota archaeon]|nr:NAD(P)/FAD-dependent oxidoreductase [Candidatus Korarchaeota archaeon]
MSEWDVVIVGAGPTGLFAAMEVKKLAPEADVLVIELGKDLEGRKCPLKDVGKCLACPICDIVSGFGGAGTFSDGKLNLTKDVGGDLASLIGEEDLWDLIDYVDDVFLEMGAPKKVYGEDKEAIERLKSEALRSGLLLIPFRIRHMGSDGGYRVLMNFRRRLLEMGVSFRFGISAEEILTEGDEVRGVRLSNGEELRSKYVVVAPGRVGASWLVREARRLGIRVDGGKVDLGVRVEVPYEVMEEFTEVLYEPKLIYYSETFDDRVRVFCVNPGGEVVTESYWGIVTVNGVAREDYKTENTNFAILVTTQFTEPYKDTISYALSIARMANNIAGNQPIVQRFGDLKRGRRSTPSRLSRSIVKPTLPSAVPGDLSFVLPYRYLKDILEMLQAMNEVMPGMASDHTLLYGVEVKLHTAKLDLKKNLETKVVRGLYAGGDGAGVSRGLVQAASSGVVIGRDIAKRLSR